MYMSNEKPKFHSKVLVNGSLFEMAYDEVSSSSFFIGLENGDVIRKESILINDSEVLPFPPAHDLIEKHVVLFPSDAEEYVSEAKLIEDIRLFIHKYLEVSEFLEKIAPYYVLLTWSYESFNELPYLRAIGDYGSGKSRFLKVIGSICYQPMITVGATTTAPIFRIMNQFKGTLILDEADLRFSDTNVELVKILNSGFQKEMPVLRCADSKQNHDVRAYDVFGPKIIATRNQFDDKALESRFIIEHMDGKLIRKDIPLNISNEFVGEALTLRNKCLLWKLRNWSTIGLKTMEIPYVEHRLVQIASPLLSIIDDEMTRNDLISYITKYNGELIIERGLSFEGEIFESVYEFMGDGRAYATIKEITDFHNTKLTDREKLNPRKIGSILRNKFQMNPVKINKGFILKKDIFEKHAQRLATKYGLNSEQVNDVNVVGGHEDIPIELFN